MILNGIEWNEMECNGTECTEWHGNKIVHIIKNEERRGNTPKDRQK
jgi:hypothetical protein